MSQTSTPTRPSARARTPFGDHVAETVAKLQAGYLREAPATVAILARLRAAAGTPTGSRLDVLGATAVPPEFLPRAIGDDPEPIEHAKHAALTLYAVHQQSYRERGLHRDGFGFGQAVALLAKESSSPEAVRRRFVAVGTAATFTEALHHCRGLIRLLRDKRIALDYGLFADDLRTFQHTGGPDRVRSWWGREYHRLQSDTVTSDTAKDEQ
ncbi:type I-E CRISPR-associated protein Cse2/CasB [Solwaraspora sp. WMMB335]|uniref:type I-E CRISPR-associated protein Cse2/CasB n=1 Tax=Solwaraspora sp. WMMB335 TaxID=3404118 RepID=UPI003B937FA9